MREARGVPNQVYERHNAEAASADVPLLDDTVCLVSVRQHVVNQLDVSVPGRRRRVVVCTAVVNPMRSPEIFGSPYGHAYRGKRPKRRGHRPVRLPEPGLLVSLGVDSSAKIMTESRLFYRRGNITHPPPRPRIITGTTLPSVYSSDHIPIRLLPHTTATAYTTMASQVPPSKNKMPADRRMAPPNVDHQTPDDYKETFRVSRVASTLTTAADSLSE